MSQSDGVSWRGVSVTAKFALYTYTFAVFFKCYEERDINPSVDSV